MDRELFLAACRTALELAGSRPVRERWDQESSCAGMSVGGLAHHLLGQLGHTVDRLREPPPRTRQSRSPTTTGGPRG